MPEHHQQLLPVNQFREMKIQGGEMIGRRMRQIHDRGEIPIGTTGLAMHNREKTDLHMIHCTPI